MGQLGDPVGISRIVKAARLERGLRPSVMGSQDGRSLNDRWSNNRLFRMGLAWLPDEEAKPRMMMSSSGVRQAEPPIVVVVAMAMTGVAGEEAMPAVESLGTFGDVVGMGVEFSMAHSGGEV